MTEAKQAQDGRDPQRRILYCHCNYSRVVPKNTKAAVLEGLSDSGVPFDAVPDLCELAAQQDPSLTRLAAGGQGVDIVACYPRAVKWLFHAAEAPLPEEGVTIHNMRTQEPEAVLDAVFGTAEASNPDTEVVESAEAVESAEVVEAAEAVEVLEEVTP
ncbi:MAG: hypothetical protein AAGN66_13400 [Acidobacteriota bacterium]